MAPWGLGVHTGVSQGRLGHELGVVGQKLGVGVVGQELGWVWWPGAGGDKHHSTILV